MSRRSIAHFLVLGLICLPAAAQEFRENFNSYPPASFTNVDGDPGGRWYQNREPEHDCAQIEDSPGRPPWDSQASLPDRVFGLRAR